MSRKVTRDGRYVDLTAKEFSLLEFLLERRGQCCSRAELLKEVWQMAPDAGTNVVDVYINYLRKKLGASSDRRDDFLIETIRGAGYMVGGTGRKPVRSEVLFGQIPLQMIGQQAEAS